MIQQLLQMIQQLSQVGARRFSRLLLLRLRRVMISGGTSRVLMAPLLLLRHLALRSKLPMLSVMAMSARFCGSWPTTVLI